MDSARQDRLFANLGALAGALVNGVDVADVADRVMAGCLDLLSVSSAGLLLEDQRGTLAILACSSEDTRELELLELQSREGPCYAAFRTGREVLVDDVATTQGRWPVFAPPAHAQGIVMMAAFPLLVGDRAIGGLNLARKTVMPLSARELQLARLLASVATIGVVHHRRVRDRELLAQQLQTALESRVCIEQAKGIIAARAGVSMGAAFDMLRAAARASRRPLADLAGDLVAGRASAARFARGAPTPGGKLDAARAERHT